MSIATVEAIPLSYDLDKAFGGARGKTGTRSTTLVRLECEDGIVGWGEAFAAPRTVATLIEEIFADEVVGMLPEAAESLAERVYTGEIGGYHMGRQAFTQCALSGIETAMWDIRGKILGKPVHKLLGGSKMESIVPYASTMYHTEWDQDPSDTVVRWFLPEVMDRGSSRYSVHQLWVVLVESAVSASQDQG